jgi:hypothetical protein
MPQDVSTEKDESSEPQPSASPRPSLSSPKIEAILTRLRYVGDYVFGGDMEAYAKATGFSEHWLRRILNSSTRLRLSTFSQFVESGVVNAEWMFCGTGHMLQSAQPIDPVIGYTPPAPISSRHPVFDTSLVAPAELKPPKKRRGKIKPAKPADFLPLANDVFLTRSADLPVLLFITDPDVLHEASDVIIECLKQKYITAIAMTNEVADVDVFAAKADKHDKGSVANALKLARTAGIGFGECLGRWAFEPGDNREASILATAYDLGMPATVHTLIGESTLHLNPAIGGADYGACLGAASYIDFLTFTQFIHELRLGVVITAGRHHAALKLMGTARDAASRMKLPKPIALRVAEFITYRHDFNIVHYSHGGEYAATFPAFLTACKITYEGTADDSKPRRVDRCRNK